MSSESGAAAFSKMIGGIFLVIAGIYLLTEMFYDWGGIAMMFCGVIAIFDI
jgi:hypothetical protein